MSKPRMAAVVLLALVGIIWFAQGTGLLQSSSYMTGEPLWAGIGLACLVAAILLLLNRR